MNTKEFATHGGCDCLQCDPGDCPCDSLFTECGPCCTCPPSCSVRVKISLIFQTFQQPSNVPLSLRFDDRKGWCLVTRAGIPTGTPVCCYVGELVPQKQIRSRQELGRRGQGTHLLTVREHTSRGLLVTSLDAGRSGNISRFVNHSCAPNLTPCPLRCGVFVPTVVLVTLRDVAAGEELTFSYGRGQRNSTTPCYCGAADCQAFLPLDYFWDT